MPHAAVGTDMVDVDRFRKKPHDGNRRFYNSIYTNREMKYCLKYSDPYPHFAGIFAAKEAIMKCLSTKVAMKDIEIIRKNDKPFPVIHIKGSVKLVLSISHTETLAMAVAMQC